MVHSVAIMAEFPFRGAHVELAPWRQRRVIGPLNNYPGRAPETLRRSCELLPFLVGSDHRARCGGPQGLRRSAYSPGIGAHRRQWWCRCSL